MRAQPRFAGEDGRTFLIIGEDSLAAQERDEERGDEFAGAQGG